HDASLQVGGKQLDELVDVTAEIGVATDCDVRGARLEQVTRIDHVQAQVARRIERHLGQNANAEAHLAIGLDYVGVDRRQHHVGNQTLRFKGALDGRAA